MMLENYKEIVATCASVSTIAQMFAGVLICKDIYYKGSSKGFNSMPFLGGTGMCTLMLQYALILKDPAMIYVNICGFLLNMSYMVVYYLYSPDKNYILGLVGKAVAFVAIFLGYAQLEHPDNIEFRFGIIVTVLLLLLIGSPLFDLGEIVRKKSTEGLPFPLIFMGTIVTFQWLLYGLIIDNAFIIFQNAVAFTLSAAQLSLFVIFPSAPAKETKLSDKKKEN